MNGFLIGIIGVVFLGVLVDIIYPNGKTYGFCKSIFAIISLAMILKPILNITNINFESVNYVNSNFVESINDARIDAIKRRIESVLITAGIEGVDVEIECNLDNNEIEIENVYLDISTLVLTENITNINKYEVLLSEITKSIDVDKERIIIYG